MSHPNISSSVSNSSSSPPIVAASNQPLYFDQPRYTAPPAQQPGQLQYQPQTQPDLSYQRVDEVNTLYQAPSSYIMQQPQQIYYVHPNGTRHQGFSHQQPVMNHGGGGPAGPRGGGGGVASHQITHGGGAFRFQPPPNAPNAPIHTRVYIQPTPGYFQPHFTAYPNQLINVISGNQAANQSQFQYQFQPQVDPGGNHVVTGTPSSTAAISHYPNQPMVSGAGQPPQSNTTATHQNQFHQQPPGPPAAIHHQYPPQTAYYLTTQQTIPGHPPPPHLGQQTYRQPIPQQQQSAVATSLTPVGVPPGGQNVATVGPLAQSQQHQPQHVPAQPQPPVQQPPPTQIQHQPQQQQPTQQTHAHFVTHRERKPLAIVNPLTHEQVNVDNVSDSASVGSAGGGGGGSLKSDIRLLGRNEKSGSISSTDADQDFATKIKDKFKEEVRGTISPRNSPSGSPAPPPILPLQHPPRTASSGSTASIASGIDLSVPPPALPPSVRVGDKRTPSPAHIQTPPPAAQTPPYAPSIDATPLDNEPLTKSESSLPTAVTGAAATTVTVVSDSTDTAADNEAAGAADTTPVVDNNGATMEKPGETANKDTEIISDGAAPTAAVTGADAASSNDTTTTTAAAAAEKISLHLPDVVSRDDDEKQEEEKEEKELVAGTTPRIETEPPTPTIADIHIEPADVDPVLPLPASHTDGDAHLTTVVTNAEDANTIEKEEVKPADNAVTTDSSDAAAAAASDAVIKKEEDTTTAAVSADDKTSSGKDQQQQQPTPDVVLAAEDAGQLQSRDTSQLTPDVTATATLSTADTGRQESEEKPVVTTDVPLQSVLVPDVAKAPEAATDTPCPPSTTSTTSSDNVVSVSVPPPAAPSTTSTSEPSSTSATTVAPVNQATTQPQFPSAPAPASRAPAMTSSSSGGTATPPPTDTAAAATDDASAAAKDKYSYVEELWVPPNPEEKRRYDRDFLLKINKDIAAVKPANLPNYPDIVLSTPHSKDKVDTFYPGFLQDPNFMGGGGGGSGGSRHGPGGGGGGRPMYRGRNSNPHPSQRQAPMVIIPPPPVANPIKRGDGAWAPKIITGKTSQSPEDVIYGEVRAIMNKLTPQMMDVLSHQLLNLINNKVTNKSLMTSTIDIIFDKAIEEPNYCVTYASICKMMVDAKIAVTDPDKPNDQVTFRVLIIGRCQSLFTRGKRTNEKIEKLTEKLETARQEFAAKQKDKEVSVKEKEAAERSVAILETDLAEQEYKEKLRTLGNIRFIGELFKLNILNEKIMHHCIRDLLKASEDIDSLECFCRLMETVGKDLDVAKCSNMMDQYFNRVKKIINDSKVPARIRFLLQDVIDLRHNNYVKRHFKQDNVPKKIEEIHSTFKAEEAQKIKVANEFAATVNPAQFQKQPRPDGASFGKSGLKPNNPTPGMAPSEMNKLDIGRLTQKSESSQRLGGFGFGRARLGPHKQMMASASSSIQQQTSSPDERRLGPMRPGLRPASRSQEFQQQQQSLYSGGAAGGPGGADRSDALAAARSIMGRPRPGSSRENSRPGSRSASREKLQPAGGAPGAEYGGGTPSAGYGAFSHKSGGGAMASLPPTHPGAPSSGSPPMSAAALRITPATPSSPASTRSAAAVMDPSALEKLAKRIVDEYLHHNNLEDASKDVEDFIRAAGSLTQFTYHSLNYVLERNQLSRQHVGTLHHLLISRPPHLLSAKEYTDGFALMLTECPDLVIDIPQLWKYLAELIAPPLKEGSLSMSQLPHLVSNGRLLVPHIDEPLAHKLVVAILNQQSDLLGHKTVGERWRAAQLLWSKFLPPDQDEQKFIIENGLEYTIASSPRASGQAPPSFKTFEESLRAELSKVPYVQDAAIFDFIDAQCDTVTKELCYSLAYAVSFTAVSQNVDEPKVDSSIVEGRKNVLRKYIDNKPDNELMALKGAEAVANQLKHPPSVLKEIFSLFYDNELISSDGFMSWRDQVEDYDGHSIAVKSVGSLFHILQDDAAAAAAATVSGRSDDSPAASTASPRPTSASDQEIVVSRPPPFPPGGNMPGQRQPGPQQQGLTQGHPDHFHRRQSQPSNFRHGQAPSQQQQQQSYSYQGHHQHTPPPRGGVGGGYPGGPGQHQHHQQRKHQQQRRDNSRDKLPPSRQSSSSSQQSSPQPAGFASAAQPITSGLGGFASASGSTGDGVGAFTGAGAGATADSPTPPVGNSSASATLGDSSTAVGNRFRAAPPAAAPAAATSVPYRQNSRDTSNPPSAASSPAPQSQSAHVTSSASSDTSTASAQNNSKQ